REIVGRKKHLAAVYLVVAQHDLQGGGAAAHGDGVSAPDVAPEFLLERRRMLAKDQPAGPEDRFDAGKDLIDLRIVEVRSSASDHPRGLTIRHTPSVGGSSRSRELTSSALNFLRTTTTFVGWQHPPRPGQSRDTCTRNMRGRSANSADRASCGARE